MHAIIWWCCERLVEARTRIKGLLNHHSPEYLQLVKKVREIDPLAADYLLGKRVRKIYRFIERGTLDQCFVWSQSPQGWEYWANIADQLEEGGWTEAVFRELRDGK